MWLQTVSPSTPDSCQCPTCGGHVLRRKHGEMYAGAFILDGVRVEIRRVPADGFVDPILLDPTSQYFEGTLFKCWPRSPYFTGGPRNKTLHREVWARAFGPIPPDCHIHHRDGVTVNNTIANLECLPAREHLSKSSRQRKWPIKTSELLAASELDRLKKWHREDASKIWHERTKDRATTWPIQRRVSKLCVHCGVEFMGLDRAGMRAAKYCGDKCRHAAYWARKYPGPKQPGPTHIFARTKKPCAQCGVEISAMERSGPTGQKYCTSKCCQIAYTKRKAAKLSSERLVHQCP